MWLQKKDRLLILASLVVFVLIVTATAWMPETSGEALRWVAAVLCLAVISLRLHRNLDRRTKQRAQDDFRQMQQFHSLLQLMQPTAPLPPMRETAGSPDFLCLLWNLVIELRPRLILEAGSGVSTLVQAYALRRLGAGRLLSLDHEKLYADISRATLERHGLQALAEVVHAPITAAGEGPSAALRWYDMAALQGVTEIDLLVVDGPPSSVQPLARYPALPLLHGRLSSRAVVLLDDADRPDERAAVAAWLREFPNLEAQWMTLEKGACVLRPKAPR